MIGPVQKGVWSPCLAEKSAAEGEHVGKRDIRHLCGEIDTESAKRNTK